MKYSALFKEMFREIWKSRNRFLSILGIVAIGCGFFSGIKASCPDMKLTAEQYFADNNLMDLHLVSTFGFNEDDLSAISQMSGIGGVMPAYSTDAFVASGENSEMIVHAVSIQTPQPASDDENYMNRPQLIEGRLPEKSGECVIDENLNDSGQYAIGGTITLEPDSGEDLSETLDTTTFTIVGIVRSPQYIHIERGNTTIGDGVIDAFIMLPEGDFCVEVYTDVYLTLAATEGLSPFSTDYEETVASATEAFEDLAERRSQERYDEIYDEAAAKIEEAKQELSDGEKEQEEQLSDARQQIADAEQEIIDGWKELEDGQREFDEKIADAEQQIADGEKTLEDGEKEYEEGLAQYEEGLKEYKEGLQQFEQEKESALALLRQYESQAEDLRGQIADGEAQMSGGRGLVQGIGGITSSFENASISDPTQFPPEVSGIIENAEQLSSLLPDGSLPEGVSISGILTQYITSAAGSAEKATLKAQLEGLTGQVSTVLDEQEANLQVAKDGLAQLEQGIEEGYRELEEAQAQLDEAKAQLDEAKAQLDAAREELDAGWAELEESKATLAEEKANGEQELADARAQLEDGEAQLEQAKIDYEEGKAESDQQLADARKEIRDAENELEDLEGPQWYVWDRENNPGYSDYGDDAAKVDAIATVFPVFFILVAALVCLTTMTRMVEEQRTQIGTMKALGYGRGAIMMKYVTYAILASILGSAVGLSIGMQLFPKIIINAYGILYDLPKALTPFRWDYAFWCTLVAIACTGISALIACYKELQESPAQLMRPKAPKAGKRVLLERWTFLWSKLSFTYKVTLRNLFRYKKRMLMTVIGIGGCTALILTGFGMQYAITSISDRQFGDIFVYDGVAAVESSEAEGGITALEQKFSEASQVSSTLQLMSKSVDVQNGDTVKSVSLYVPQKPEDISQYIVLQERVGKAPLSLTDEGVVINEKLSKLLQLGVGDTLTINEPDGRPIQVKITGVTENYAMNFVYMTPQLYDEVFREEPEYNMIYFNMTDPSQESELSNYLMEQDGVLGVTYTASSSGQFDDMVGSLGIIVWVLIFSAGALAFIVLYNLTNININERIRELATIKVLGFYDREVSAYIYRENTISALIGMAVGLVVGIFFERFVILTAEVDMVMFVPDIAPYCFILAAVLTILFTVIVNIVVHFKLKKIDMVESLKSVE